MDGGWINVKNEWFQCHLGTSSCRGVWLPNNCCQCWNGVCSPDHLPSQWHMVCQFRQREELRHEALQHLRSCEQPLHRGGRDVYSDERADREACRYAVTFELWVSTTLLTDPSYCTMPQGSCQCGVLRVVPMSVWVSSGLSGLFVPGIPGISSGSTALLTRIKQLLKVNVIIKIWKIQEFYLSKFLRIWDHVLRGFLVIKASLLLISKPEISRGGSMSPFSRSR